MKKFIITITILGIIVFSVYAFVLKICPENRDFNIILEDIIVEDLSDLDIENCKVYEDFYGQSMSDEIVSSVITHPNNFKKISLKFMLYNNSKKITMEDISINHKFVPELEKKVMTYNNKNGDITLFLYPKGDLNYPQYTTRFDQKILVNSDGIKNNEIERLFMDGNCEVTYFTGPFSITNGQETSGVGKHTKYCAIRDIKDN